MGGDRRRPGHRPPDPSGGARQRGIGIRVGDRGRRAAGEGTGHKSVAPDGVQPDELVRVPEGTPPEQDLFVERALEVLADGMAGTDAPPGPASEGEPNQGTSLLPAGADVVSYDPR